VTCQSVLVLAGRFSKKLTRYPCVRDWRHRGDCASAEGYQWRTVREWRRLLDSKAA
jgi:hypothetical protein